MAGSASPDTVRRGSVSRRRTRGDGPPLRAKAGAAAFRLARLCLRRDAERTEETPRPKGMRISGESEAGFRGEYL